MDDEVVVAAERCERAEVLDGLCAKARAGDVVAAAAVRDLLAIKTLPDDQRAALEASLKG